MNYELAKQLKDAGFPQQYTEEFEYMADGPYQPTLEELIEACPRFASLSSEKDAWYAYSYVRTELTNTFTQGKGATPAEAVANLYLALNKKI